MARAARDSALAFALLELLVTQHRNFDKLTRTRTITTLIENLCEDDKMRYVALLFASYSHVYSSPTLSLSLCLCLSVCLCLSPLSLSLSLSLALSLARSLSLSRARALSLYPLRYLALLFAAK
jgi:hypothetical protein